MQGGDIALGGGHIAFQGSDIPLGGGHIALQGGDIALGGGHIAFQGGDIALGGGHIALQVSNIINFFVQFMTYRSFPAICSSAVNYNSITNGDIIQGDIKNTFIEEKLSGFSRHVRGQAFFFGCDNALRYKVGDPLDFNMTGNVRRGNSYTSSGFFQFD